MSNLCIIPARGGSKRIPHKNIKPFMGKPIIAYSIEAALKSKLFDEVMVSTDDEEIAVIAKQYGAKVPFMRSAATANDFATTVDVIVEVLNTYKEQDIIFDRACCLYSTAPFVTPNRLIEAYHKINGPIDSVFTVVAYSYPIQRSLKMTGDRVSMNYPQYIKSRSQDLETLYHDAGQFYFFTVDAFEKTKAIWGSNTTSLILSELEVQDLDTETDWKLAEMKYSLLANETKNIF